MPRDDKSSGIYSLNSLVIIVLFFTSMFLVLVAVRSQTASLDFETLKQSSIGDIIEELVITFRKPGSGREILRSERLNSALDDAVDAYLQGDYDKSLDDFKKALKIDPGNAQALSGWGLILHSRDDLDGAIDKFRQAVTADPSDLIAYRWWGDALADKGNLSGAIEKYSHVFKEDPNDAPNLRSFGEALRKTGDIEGAIEKYRRTILIESDNKNYYGLTGLGRLLDETGKTAEAIDLFRRATKVQPTRALAHELWIERLIEDRALEDAIARIEIAVELIPDDAYFYAAWGRVLERQGHRKEAAEKYKKAMGLDPDSYGSYETKINLWEDKGKLDAPPRKVGRKFKHASTYTYGQNMQIPNGKN